MANPSASVAARRIAPPSARAAAPASTPPSAPPPSIDSETPDVATALASLIDMQNKQWAAIGAIQQTLNVVLPEFSAAPASEETTSEPEPAAHDRTAEARAEFMRQLKRNLKPHPHLKDGPKGVWLTDLAKLAGLSKNTSHTVAEYFAYRGKVGLAKERNERIGKLAFWVTVR